MQTTINISLDVAKAARKQYAHDALCGIMKMDMKTDKSDKELIEEYLKEKYQI